MFYYTIAVLDDFGTLDHFLSLKLLNSMIHPLCLFNRTVNITKNLKSLELNVEFKCREMQTWVKFIGIIFMFSLLIDLLFTR